MRPGFGIDGERIAVRAAGMTRLIPRKARERGVAAIIWLFAIGKRSAGGDP